MNSVCGIIDPSLIFSGERIDFSALKRMWCSFAPLGRGYTYIKSGIALCCNSAVSTHATLPCPQEPRKNCSVMLCGTHPSPFFPSDIIESYFLFGTESLCKIKDTFSFVFLDESNRLLIISCADIPFYCSRVGEKIIFSSERVAIDAYFEGSTDLFVPPVQLPPNGFALFCDIKN